MATNQMTWNAFKELSLNNYIPIGVMRAKEVEFINLKWGSMTLVEYERKFEELSHYA